MRFCGENFQTTIIILFPLWTCSSIIFFPAELQNMLFTRRFHYVQCTTSTLMNSYGSDVTFRLSRDQHANHNSSLSSQQSLHSLLRFAVLSQSADTFRLDILSSKDNGFHFFCTGLQFCLIFLTICVCEFKKQSLLYTNIWNTVQLYLCITFSWRSKNCMLQ